MSGLIKGIIILMGGGLFTVLALGALIIGLVVIIGSRK